MSSRNSPLGPAVILGFSALGFALYGSGLGIGYLSDDFLYLAWLDQGFDELLRKLTTDSYPRMIRPITAFGWLLSWLPAGAWLQHALSVALHVCNALLVTLLVERFTDDRAESSLEARLCGLLFLACPLFTEPVLWLSSSPDLWATAFALCTLLLGRGQSGVFAAICFAAALLAKESIVVTPWVALCWWLGHGENNVVQRARGLILLAIVYLLGRWLLFGGLGGYLDAQGQSIAGRFDALQYLRNLMLQLPYRLLMPLKRAGDWTVPIALVSSLCFLAVGLAALRHMHRSRDPGSRDLGSRELGLRSLGAVVAFGIATWPVAPVLSVDVDHGGGRLIYFPFAIGVVGLGHMLLALPSEARRKTTWVLTLLLLLWMPILVANIQSWRFAGLEIQDTLDHLKSAEPYPPGATVWIDGNDSFHGAYVWRNGFHHALERAGLEPYKPWRLGTPAESPQSFMDGSLGRTVFQLGRNPQGRWHDRTPCLMALVAEPRPPSAVHPLPPGSRHELSMGFEPIDGSLTIKMVSDGPVAGFVSWRYPGIPRFNVTERRPFRADSGQPSLLPLTILGGPIDQLHLRFELTSSGPAALKRVELSASPELCKG